MLDALMEASPSAGSWRHNPMSVSEIDAHPDADRIWATIKSIRDEADEAYQRGCDDTAGEIEEAVKEERADCVTEMERWLEDLLERPDLKTADDFRDALLATDCEEVLK